MKRVIIYLLGAAAIIAIGYALGTLANRGSPPTRTTPNTSAAVASTLSSEPVPVAGGYTIVSTEQVRAGNIADIKSVIVRAALTEVITQSQAEPTLHAILERVRTSDPDIDEVIVFLYSDPAITEGAYDIGTTRWQPAGGRINLTATIARTNDRSNYQTTVEVEPGIDAYLAARSSPSIEHGLTVDQRRAYFRDIALADERAMRDADARINPNSDVMGNIRLYNELREQYREEVTRAHGVDPNVVGAILLEGQRMNWPMR